MPEREGVAARDRQLCLGQRHWTRRGLWQPRKIQLERRVSRKTNKTSQDTWFGGARTGRLWLCYARSLAGKRKVRSQVVGEDPKPTPRLPRRTVGKIKSGGR